MSTEFIGNYYDKIADAGYDEIYDGSICKAEDQVLLSFVLGNIDNKKVLDIGCGTGMLASYVQGHNVDLTGVDVSHNELKQALDKKYQKSAYAQADMSNLPFENDQFDVVVSAFGPFSYSLSPEITLQEFQRVLKSDGKLIVMPYTERTGQSIGLGGFSTAVESSIPKIYYSESMAKNVFSELDNLQVYGINYFHNLIFSQDKVSIKKVDKKLLVNNINFLSSNLDSHNEIDLEGIDLEAICEMWNQYIKSEGDEKTSMLEANLRYETSTFRGLIPAHFARHMVVTGSKSI